MRSRAQVGDGHPLHPMLIAFPIGALAIAFVLDLGALWTGQAAWFTAAFVATALGTIGIFIAAVPGMVDYRAIVPPEGRIHRQAFTHLLLGLALAALFVVSTMVHWMALGAPASGGALGATALNLIGILGLAAQGWIGGELVYRGGLGVMPAEPTEDTREPGVRPRGQPEKGRRSI
jgi:uncharacterized membrane protein